MIGEEQYNNIWASSMSNDSDSEPVVRNESDFEDANVSDDYVDDEDMYGDASGSYGANQGNLFKNSFMEPSMSRSHMTDKQGTGVSGLESSLSIYKLEEYSDYEQLVLDVMKIHHVSDQASNLQLLKNISDSLQGKLEIISKRDKKPKKAIQIAGQVILGAQLSNFEDLGVSDQEDSFTMKNSNLDLLDEEEKSIEPIQDSKSQLNMSINERGQLKFKSHRGNLPFEYL